MHKQKREVLTSALYLIYTYSTSHKWLALMLWASHQSPSALLRACGENVFSWDGTSSIKSRKKPFSVMTNTRRLAHMHSRHQETGRRIWIALRQITKVLYFSTYPLLYTYIQTTWIEIPFCQLSAPDHVTIKDAALQLNTASKSQGKESCEKHLFLSSMRDHTRGGL